MKVELKKLKTYAALSEETVAFTADVWINGKRSGDAKNDGHGGCTLVRISDRDLAKQLVEFGDSQKPAGQRFLDPGDAWLVDQLVEQAEIARHAKKTAAVEAKFKAECAARGKRVARFKSNSSTVRWMEIDDESVARWAAEKKFGTVSEWTVLS